MGVVAANDLAMRATVVRLINSGRVQPCDDAVRALTDLLARTDAAA
jgi:hypothetical protein